LVRFDTCVAVAPPQPAVGHIGDRGRLHRLGRQINIDVRRRHFDRRTLEFRRRRRRRQIVLLHFLDDGRLDGRRDDFHRARASPVASP
jgi:hypothetical protein